MEIYPWSEDGAKYGYTMMAIVTTVVTAAWLQYTGAWLPFVMALVWALFILWDLYLVDFLAGGEMSEEDKALAAQTQFLTDTTGTNVQRAKKERVEMENLIKTARKEREELQSLKTELEAMNGKR